MGCGRESERVVVDGWVVCAFCGYRQSVVADFCLVGVRERAYAQRCNGRMDKAALARMMRCSNVMCGNRVSVPNSVWVQEWSDA